MDHVLPSQQRVTSHWRPTITYFLMFIGIGMIGGILGPALPFLAEQSGSTMSQIAILFTARALGNMTGSVISGFLLDKFKGHRVLVGMITLAVIGMILMPVSPLLIVMTVVIFVLGFAEVSMNAGGNVMIMWLHRERSGPFISTLHFSYGVGAMAVPLLIVVAVNSGISILWSFWLVALYVVIVGVFLAPQNSPTSPSNDGSDHVDKVYDKAVFVGLLVLVALYVGMELTFVGWITTYGVINGMTQGDAALLVSVFWFSLSMGRLLALPILRAGYFTTLLYSCLSLAVAMMVSLYVGGLNLYLLTFIFGLSLSAIFPTLFTLGNQLVSLNGKRTGMIFLAAGLGAMVAPTVIGPLIENFGTDALPLLLAGMLSLKAIGLALILLRQRMTRQRAA
ncbi:MAG: MFS transporter [Natronospirillum sp.]